MSVSPDHNKHVSSLLEKVSARLVGVHLLDKHRIIDVSGDDSEAFLNSQFTSNVNKIVAATGESFEKSTTSFAAWCDNKGRVNTIFLVFRHSNSQFSLIVPNELTDAAIAQLKRYIFRSKVSIEKSSNKVFVQFANNNNDAMNSSFHPIDVASTNSNVLTTKHIDASIKAHVGIINEERFLSSSPDININGSDVFELWQILNGIPVIQAANQNSYVAQMLNLDKLDMIDFDKGCYPGQEIIARAKYLGQVKKHLYFGSITATESAKPEESVELEQSSEPASLANTLLLDSAGNEVGNILYVSKTAMTVTATYQLIQAVIKDKYITHPLQLTNSDRCSINIF